MENPDFNALRDDSREPFKSGEIDLQEPKKNLTCKIVVGVIIVVVVGVAIFLLVYFLTKSNNDSPDDKKDSKKHKMMRLKNWEFGNSEKIKLSPEQISKGESSENLFKAPGDFYVCTAMGGLSGHTNKYYYEQELKKVDKEQFNDTWWFRSHFEFNDTLSKDNLTLLHINGINYKSDIYIDGNLVAKKEDIIGTFVKYSLDITKFLDFSIKKHFIAFKISRPHNQWGGKQKTI